MSCITLLSDFGLQDPSVAIAKGVLMCHAPGVAIIDISHEIKPYHAGQAAYLLASAYKNFPPETCHILLFDIFSEPVPRLVAAAHAGHFFLAPDNGFLPLALGVDTLPGWLCFELKKENSYPDWLSAAGKIAAMLQTATPETLDLPPVSLKILPAANTPSFTANEILCDVVHIDQFENVVLNITRQQFERHGNGRPFRIEFMNMEESIEKNSLSLEKKRGYIVTLWLTMR